MESRAGLGTLLWVFFKLGMTSFGGGLSGWIHREAVERRGWMSEEQFLAGVAITQVLPGPNAVNLALHIGLQLRGAAGAAVAGLGILGPPFAFILVLAALYQGIAGAPVARAVLAGLAAAGLGMTCVMGARGARRLRGAAPIGVAVATFGAVGLLRWPMIPVVLALAPLSIALAWREARGGR